MIPTPVETVLSRPANTLPRTAKASEAARRLRDPHVPAVVVLDERDEVAGIVTDSDLVALVAEACEDVPVADIVSGPVVTVSPEESVRTAARRMRESGVAHLVVVEDGICCGLVTRDALAPHVSRHTLDVEWQGEPLRVEGPAPSEARVAE